MLTEEQFVHEFKDHRTVNCRTPEECEGVLRYVQQLGFKIHENSLYHLDPNSPRYRTASCLCPGITMASEEVTCFLMHQRNPIQYSDVPLPYESCEFDIDELFTMIM